MQFRYLYCQIPLVANSMSHNYLYIPVLANSVLLRLLSNSVRWTCKFRASHQQTTGTTTLEHWEMAVIEICHLYIYIL